MSKITTLAGLIAAALLTATPATAGAADEKTPSPVVKHKERVVVVQAPGEKGQEEREFVFIGPDGEKTFTGKFPGRSLDAMPRGYVGVALLDLTPELRRHFGASDEAGVMISRVEEGSPAAAAGVAVGDILVAVDGTKVEGAWDVRRLVRDKKKGESVRFDLLRDRRAQSVTAVVAERETPQLDIGSLMLWDEDGERVPIQIPEIDTEHLKEITEQFQKHQFQLEEGKARELERKMEELEQQLRELEQKLREKSSLAQPRSVS